MNEIEKDKLSIREKKGIAYILTAEALWGFTGIMTKQVVNHYSVLTLLSWRLTIAVVFMTLLIKIGVLKVDLKHKKPAPLIILGILQPCLFFTGETVGIKMTTASEAGVFLAMIPVMTLFLATIFFKKHPGTMQTIGAFVSVVGILIVMIYKGIGISFNIIGYLFLLMAVSSAALFSLLVEKYSDYTSVEKTYVMSILGALVFVIGSFGEHKMAGTLNLWLTLPFRDMTFLASVLYLGIGCSFLAYTCLNKAIEYIGPTRTNIFASINTVLAVLSGVIFLKEEINLMQWGGIVLVILGVYMANKSNDKRKEEKC